MELVRFSLMYEISMVLVHLVVPHISTNLDMTNIVSLYEWTRILTPTVDEKSLCDQIWLEKLMKNLMTAIREFVKQHAFELFESLVNSSSKKHSIPPSLDSPSKRRKVDVSSS